MILSNSFMSSLFWPPPCIIRSNSAMFATSISATSIQYRSEQTSVMTRIFGMPTLALSLAIARNLSNKGRTIPCLQYMISRMRSMRVHPCVGWAQAAAGRLTGNYAEFPRSSSLPRPTPSASTALGTPGSHAASRATDRGASPRRADTPARTPPAPARPRYPARPARRGSAPATSCAGRTDTEGSSLAASARAAAPPRASHRAPQYAQKAQERQMIGRIARDDADPPHGGVIGGAVRRLRRETLEQAPCVVEPSAHIVGEGETKPVGHGVRLRRRPAFQPPHRPPARRRRLRPVIVRRQLERRDQ